MFPGCRVFDGLQVREVAIFLWRDWLSNASSTLPSVGSVLGGVHKYPHFTRSLTAFRMASGWIKRMVVDIY
jgi:hypothetical protein